MTIKNFARGKDVYTKREPYPAPEQQRQTYSMWLHTLAWTASSISRNAMQARCYNPNGIKGFIVFSGFAGSSHGTSIAWSQTRNVESSCHGSRHGLTMPSSYYKKLNLRSLGPCLKPNSPIVDGFTLKLQESVETRISKGLREACASSFLRIGSHMRKLRTLTC